MRQKRMTGEQGSRVECFLIETSSPIVLDDLHLAANATLAVDRLATLLGLHAGTEADLAGAFYFADAVRVMQGNPRRCVKSLKFSTFRCYPRSARNAEPSILTHLNGFG